MKICFVLPRFTRRPIGGFKIVYEYANRLCTSGDKVCFLFVNDNVFLEYKVPRILKSLCSNIMTQLEPRWFPLNKSIRKISGIHSIKNKLQDVDVCIATGAETVAVCKKVFPLASKCYLIQDFETWVMSEKELFETFNAGFKNIVVSSWLEKLVDAHSDEKSILIKNPIDLTVYRPIVPIQQRNEHSIGLLYHSGEHKGLKYSLAALEKLKELYPDLEVYMFGTSEPKVEVPGLVRFVKDASQKETVELYNEVSVFMCSTINEGYGLTAMEAMACGAAVVSSDYEGIHEYGINGVNCLLSPLRDVNAMVANVSKLFEDNDLRYLIANQGVSSLKEYDWEAAFKKFKNTICG